MRALWERVGLCEGTVGEGKTEGKGRTVGPGHRIL